MVDAKKLKSSLLAKKDRILEIRDDVMKAGRRGKLDFEKEWFRNCLLFVGRHWISWNQSRRQWVDTPDLGKWYPKPVTNKFSEAMNSLKALLTEKDVRPLVTPATESEEDVATAQRSDIWVDVIRDEADSKTADTMAASWITITGNCFFHEYCFVSKENGEIGFNLYNCQACGAKLNAMEIEENKNICPQCGQETEFEQAVGADGVPEQFTMPKSKMRDDACSPFEIFFNCNIDKWEDVKEVIRAKSVPVREIEDTYPELKGKVQAGSGGDMPQVYKKALKTVTSGTSGHGAAIDGEGVPETDVHYLFVKPNSEFKEGIYAAIVGNEFAELDTLVETYSNKDGLCYIPITYGGANFVPGRFWHKTRADDIAQKQFDRNLFESLIHLQFLTLASGKWLDPGTNMDEPTGEPGQQIKYDYTIEGRKPELVQGIPPPPVLIQFLEIIDKDIESLSATYDVLKGNLPPGLDTFSGLRLLTERAFSVHGDMIKNWERVQIAKLKIQLELARKYFIEPRTKTIEGENGGYETKEFSRADLMGGVDIKIEPGSSIPKSQSVENAAIVEDIKLGIIDVTDPKINYKVLERQGLQDLAQASGDDIKDAMKEWKDFLESVKANRQAPDQWILRPRNGIDNEAIHYRDAASRAKADAFFELPLEAQKIWEEHALYHKANLEAELMQQAMIQAGPGAQKKEMAAA